MHRSLLLALASVALPACSSDSVVRCQSDGAHPRTDDDRDAAGGETGACGSYRHLSAERRHGQPEAVARPYRTRSAPER